MGSKYADVKSAALKVFYNDKDFFKQIKGCFASKEPNLTTNTIALFRIFEKDFKDRKKLEAVANESKNDSQNNLSMYRPKDSSIKIISE